MSRLQEILTPQDIEARNPFRGTGMTIESGTAWLQGLGISTQIGYHSGHQWISRGDIYVHADTKKAALVQPVRLGVIGRPQCIHLDNGTQGSLKWFPAGDYTTGEAVPRYPDLELFPETIQDTTDIENYLSWGGFTTEFTQGENGRGVLVVASRNVPFLALDWNPNHSDTEIGPNYPWRFIKQD